MITRGLSYRNDGPKLADAKERTYVGMLMRYPIDATTAVTSRLRPDGWLPSADTIEQEIRDVLEGRLDIFRALSEGEIYTKEQIWSMENRALGHDLAEALAPFPIYDTGKKSREKFFTEKFEALRLAYDAYSSFNPTPDNFIDRKLMSDAKGYLIDGFIPNPHTRETPEQRVQRMEGEREEMERRKKLMIEELGA